MPTYHILRHHKCKSCSTSVMSYCFLRYLISTKFYSGIACNLLGEECIMTSSWKCSFQSRCYLKSTRNCLLALATELISWTKTKHFREHFKSIYLYIYKHCLSKNILQFVYCNRILFKDMTPLAHLGVLTALLHGPLQ